MTKGKYGTLLQTLRRKPSEAARSGLDEEAESDRARVLYSSPFRRLQNKAQVFSLETNAAIRSRLTHSLEVSTAGRAIANAILVGLDDETRTNMGLADRRQAFVTFVETACLLHDIGNPPFGHYGELAISDWFDNKYERFATQVYGAEVGKKKSQLKKRFDLHFEDLKRFDGNPQGLRIVARLQQSRDEYGLNLTLTQLAAFIKYPCAAHDCEKNGFKKGGYFMTEKDVMDLVSKELGLRPGQRHPLVFIMEAADDISYCLSDIADGIEKQLIAPTEFAQKIIEASNGLSCSVLGPAMAILRETASGPHWERGYLKFRTDLTRFLVKEASTVFLENHTDILTGKFSGSLLSKGDGAKWLETLNGFATKYLYNSKIVRQRELTAFKVIQGLLDEHERILNCKSGDVLQWVRGITGLGLHDKGREISLLTHFPQKHLWAYLASVGNLDKSSDEYELMEWIQRAHLIVDYIAGMTDLFCLQRYHILSGITVNESL